MNWSLFVSNTNNNNNNNKLLLLNLDLVLLLAFEILVVGVGYVHIEEIEEGEEEKPNWLIQFRFFVFNKKINWIYNVLSNIFPPQFYTQLQK